jgi:hypothetical protein
MGWACGMYEEEQMPIQGCGGEPEEWVPLGTHRYIMEDNIRKFFSRNRIGWR